MKQQRLKYKLLALFLFSLIGLLAAYGGYSIHTYGSRWFSSRWNPRVAAQKASVTAGDILDRNGTVLAASSGGQRIYHSDADIRSAVVHVVGDHEGLVTHGAESFQATWLYGFRTTLPELASTLFSGEERRGDQLTLTIDSRLCAAAAKSAASSLPAGDLLSGAAVVMNWKTGEVLALTSLPSFDPMQPAAGLGTSAAQPAKNRAAQALYPIGRLGELVTAAAAMAQPSYSPDAVVMHCTGVLSVDGRLIDDGTGISHGDITLAGAWAGHCRPAFARLALGAGPAQMRKQAEAFGFQDHFLFRDLVVEDSSYPLEHGSASYETAAEGCGQGTAQATPLHMCMIASAIANGGMMQEPLLLRSVDGPTGVNRLRLSPVSYRRAVTAEHAAALADFLQADAAGSAVFSGLNGMNICGTSCEVSTDASVYGWFAGFSRDDALPAAVCVLLESGRQTSGCSAAAAAAASSVFEYLRSHPEIVQADSP